ncbi:MAG: TolB family protein [Planctomycetota bacterium]|jgi:hypothetical protein
MSRRRRTVLGASAIGILILAGVAIYACRSPIGLPDQYAEIDRTPRIFPDYQDCVIPPNIAPLNFLVEEGGSKVCVRIHGPNGEEIVVGSRNGKINIPIGPWRELLSANPGGSVSFDVYVYGGSDGWRRFKTFDNQIAHEPIDPYVVYRLLDGPNHNLLPGMATIQRHLESFDERPIWVSSEGSCANCHTFINNDPSRMLMHIRGADGTAMVLARDGAVEKINTRTRYNPPIGFTAWHPNGQVAAFSCNMLRLLHKTAGESRAAIDYTSDLGLYDLETQSIVSTRAISRPDRRESYPNWSPDGKFLYFVSGDKPWPAGTGKKQIIPPEFQDIQYDLMRIAYDAETGEFGAVETVLSAEQFGLSINEPRISPDGRFLMFIAAEYGGFPLYLDSDLYILNLESGDTWPLTEANSDQCDSWHTWSINNRWVVFGSKRRDHILTKLYITYIDEDGQASKPFVMPLRDPTRYNGLLKTYNVPELVTGPVPWGPSELGTVITPSVTARHVDAISSATTEPDETPPPSETQWDDESSLN